MILWPRPSLCLVTDRRRVNPDARTARDEVVSLEAFLDDAIGAGIDFIQIRERGLDAAVLHSLIVRLSARAEPTGTRVLVNDRVDIAIAGSAHGVHLRGDAPPSSRVRELAPAMLIGRSIHEPAETADAAGMFVFGTVFRTASKPPDAPVAGLDALAEAVRLSAVPVLAIGGINPARVRACRDAGAAGVAAIGIFLPSGRSPEAFGPAAAVTALREAWMAR